MISTTSDKWVRTKSDEVAIEQGCYFDIDAADRVRFFFARFLRHSKGQFAGKRFELLDWQWDRIIAPLFGWKMPDGSRRFRRAGIGVPKKNGKSTLLSGIGLYCLCKDDEPGAEVYSAAASRDQASIIYNEAANMVEASPALATRIALRRQAKEMDYPAERGFYKALSADVPTKEGLNASCVLFDELHAQTKWDLWNVLRFAGAARRQPLLLWISTAGIYDPESVGYVQWEYARQVQSGLRIDIGFLSCIYEASDEDDWKSEETFAKSNPSYPTTISKRDWGESVLEAINVPSSENNYKRYRINLWTRQACKWIPWIAWHACKAEFVMPSRRTRCWLGLDLASTTDITAAVLLWFHKKRLRFRPWFWLPEDAITRRERENATRLDAWADKYITITRGKVTDYEVVRRAVNDIAGECNLVDVSIDPYNATQLATRLEDDGLKVVYVRQGFLSLSPPAKEFERLVLNGGIEQPGNPVLDWMMMNVGVEEDAAGNIKPSKAKSAEKIDGVSALLTGLASVIQANAERFSVYEGKKVECL